MLACMPYIVYIFLNIFLPTVLDVGCDRCCCHFWFETNGYFLADVICHIIMPWLMFVAIVVDVNATLFVCGR